MAGTVNLVTGNVSVSTTTLFTSTGTSTSTPYTTLGQAYIVLDFRAMAAADSFRINVYNTVNASAGVVYTATLTGTQTQLYAIPLIGTTSAGWDVGLTKLAGTDRTIYWSITTFDFNQIDTEVAGVKTDTTTIIGRLPTALVSGRMDSSVGAYQSGLAPLQPTTAGCTLDVSATGEAGLDWANIGSPTTTVGLSGTTIKSATDVITDTTNIKGRLPAALVSGRMDSSVGAMATGVLTAAAIASDALAAIANSVWIYVVEGSETAVQFLRGIMYSTVDKMSVSGSTRTFYKRDGTTPGITSTVDATGRTAVTTSL